MMRSMFSGVSGLRVHQTKMDVIANNISNVNTAGYKSSRVTFSEIFSQTVAGASGANASTGKGGVNAMQIGLGANVASIDMLMTNGAAQRTDNPYDIMIQGEGFFIVSDSAGTYFTRAGAFRLDDTGNLVNPEGLGLNGWRAAPGNTPGTYQIPKTNTRPITITGEDEYLTPKMTTRIDFKNNLNADTTDVKDSSVSFYDSLGNLYTVDARFKYSSTAKTWDVQLGDRAFLNGDKTKPIAIGVTPGTVGGKMPVTIATKPAATVLPTTVAFTSVGNALTFDEFGVLTSTGTNMTQLDLKIDDSTNKVLDPKSTFATTVEVHFEGLTQFNSLANATSTTIDGNAPGTLNGVSIGSDGIVSGRYSNGKTKPLWQISIAKFKNPAGLERVGSNLYATTSNSGGFDGVGEEVGGGTKLLPGVLEMSNVDLAQEFTEMITTQRGFQANSRVITTSDDMLQELVNLKR